MKPLFPVFSREQEIEDMEFKTANDPEAYRRQQEIEDKAFEREFREALDGTYLKEQEAKFKRDNPDL